MAIVKMKRLTLLAPLEDRAGLLRELQHFGCVALEAVEEEGFRPVTSAAAEKRAQLREVRSALDILSRHVPRKKPLLSPPAEVTERAFWDEAAWETDLDTVRHIRQLQQTLDSLSVWQSQLDSQRLSLLPWQDDPLPLEAQGTRTVRLIRGTLPAFADLNAVEAGLPQAADTAVLTRISGDKDLHYLSLLIHEGQEREALEHLRSLGFALFHWKGPEGTAKKNLARIDSEIGRINGQKEAAHQTIIALAQQYDRLELTQDRAEQYLAREEAADRLRAAGSVVAVKGWLPAKQEDAFKTLMAGTDCAWSLRDPVEEEYPAVPVSLENNAFTRPLNMVTDMYSLPAYGSLDPNPLMAPFFIFFYGFMMADMGYGLLMMIASAVILKKAKPKGPTMRHMIPLLGWCGISTFFMGALTGGFFGDLLPQLSMMLNPDTTFTAMPALFSPLDDALAVLIGSLCIGLCQIFTGMGINIYKQVKRGQVMEALCNEGAWFAVFLLFAAGILLGQLKIAGILILVLLAVTQSYGKKGIVGKLMGIGGSLYSNITGYFSDILSYSRLMALMLAGTVIAQVFNTLGGITGNVILFFLISMLGNGINFALNLLGCFVHDMRLQCLEFFNRFYEDGGKPFRPLQTDPTHVNMIKE
ncbi:MAG: V-type ATP synthase subunit I [Clostridia bacterium]|nr:V-type ATP synthase subunit I [Clostridia bacterium]